MHGNKKTAAEAACCLPLRHPFRFSRIAKYRFNKSDFSENRRPIEKKNPDKV